MRVGVLAIAIFAALASAASPDVDRARQLYQRTEYQSALNLLKQMPASADTLLLTGQAYYGAGNFTEATETLEKAARLAPKNADVQHWLGRAWGRRAETSAVWNQLRYADRTHQAFERALELDPTHRGALGDLFEYYLEAPSIAGGGVDKAERLIPRIAALDPSWGELSKARLSEKRNQFTDAEQHLRRAVELAIGQAGRVVDLGRFLARRGRVEESDAAFAKAAQIAPEDPLVWFSRAKALVEKNRNRDEARQLLEKYLAATLTPEHPPRSEAQALLNRIGR